MENVVKAAFWKGKRVFLTGHTGFKGGWLALWLQLLGAEVTGYSLVPATTNNLFTIAEVGRRMRSIIGDVRDLPSLKAAMQESQPEIVLHLAAQAIVSEGYRDPIGTFQTNVLGTTNLLEAARSTSSIKTVLVITSDKCYENREWPWPYRENEPLGGHDPYSSSKACAELIVSSYRKSFLAEAGIAVATARAGNVLGGGDWSPNRLVPDLLAAFSAGNAATLRNPQSVRPWQHVLEPLAGYLLLAERIHEAPDYAAPWNFGPDDNGCVPVEQLTHQIASHWGSGACWKVVETRLPHEASILRLDSSLARQRLGWSPRFTLDAALAQTVAWHKAWLSGGSMRDYSLRQIDEYTRPA